MADESNVLSDRLSPPGMGVGMLDDRIRRGRHGFGRWVEAAAVFLVVAFGYRLMWSPVPVDDVPRYVNELRANRDVWDMAHLWLQPIGLRIFRLLGDPADPLTTLNWINTVSVALALAVFYVTARAASQSRLVALLVVALAGVSFNFVSLGPTGHIKPMVLPFFSLALHFLWQWENDLCTGRAAAMQDRRLAIAGAALGAGTCLLVTAVPLALFAALAMVLRLRSLRATWPATLGRVGLFLGAAGVVGMAGLLAAYGLAQAHGTSGGSLLSFLLSGLGEKYEVNQFHSSLLSRLARSGFSLAYNFVYLQDVGQYGRAYIDGLLPSLRPYAWAMVRDLLLALPVFAMIGCAVVIGTRQGLLKRRPTLIALGFAMGGLAYAFMLNLNDPEHWIQVTMPVLLLLAIVIRGHRAAVVACMALLPVLVIPNLLVYTLPRVTYPLAQNATELLLRMGPHGLHMNYWGYPGNMTTAVLGIPLERSVRPDIIFEQQQFDVGRTLAEIDRQLAPALRAGDPVLVFRIFDESDWRGPVASLAARGFPPEVLRRHLRDHYEVLPAGTIAGFEAYRLAPRPKR